MTDYVTDYAKRTSDAFIGKEIRTLELSGRHVKLTCTDNTVLEYEASDGAWWTVTLPYGTVVT